MLSAGAKSQNGIHRGDTEGDSLTFSRQPLQITCARIALGIRRPDNHITTMQFSRV
jgi:hypothetical protein